MPPLEAKRQQILAAAIAEFQEKGFAGASMDRIAARAEVSKRTVYNHFDGKDALFRSIVDKAAGAVKSAIGICYDPARPLVDQLTELAMAEARLSQDAEVISLSRMAASELLRDPDLARRLDLPMPHEEIFGAFFSAAAADGAIEAEAPEHIALQFLSMIKAQTFWPTVFGGAPPSDDQIARVVAAAVDTILPALGRARP